MIEEAWKSKRTRPAKPSSSARSPRVAIPSLPTIASSLTGCPGSSRRMVWVSIPISMRDDPTSAMGDESTRDAASRWRHHRFWSSATEGGCPADRKDASIPAIEPSASSAARVQVRVHGPGGGIGSELEVEEDTVLSARQDQARHHPGQGQADEPPGHP